MRTPLLTLAASLVLCGVTQAETLDVCPTGCTYSSIQDAIDASSDGDEILVGPGTYTSTHPAHVVDLKGKAVTLRSSDGPDATIIDGEGARRSIACFSSETEATVIEGFTFTNGVGIQFDYNGNGTADFWEDDGGGMYNLSSSPTLANCIFTGNTAETGAAMYNILASSPTLTNCTFTGNTASSGGGMHNWIDCSPTLTNCTFINNTTEYYGGGIYCFNNSQPTLTNCTFKDNTAGISGGGMFHYYSNSMLANCTFKNNTAMISGGGMHNFDSSPSIMNSMFCDNGPTHIDGDWINEGGNEFYKVCPPDCEADMTGDGLVNVSDFLTIISGWGNPYGISDLLAVIAAWGPCE